MTVEPLVLPPGVADGDWVTAERLVPAAVPPAELDLPPDRRVEGLLTVAWSDALEAWRATVAGQTVHPATLRRSTPPAGP